LAATINLPTGVNQQMNVTPTYFEFISSDPTIATVSSTGLVSVVGGPGSATITATVGGVTAQGSLRIQSVGNFQPAPVPTRPASRVISIFSDAYPNVPVNYYNGYWQPWQTTVSNDFAVSGNNVLNYTIFNFVGIEFSSPTVNANAMTHLHMDVFIPGPVVPGRELRVIVVDFGPDGGFQGGDDTRHSTTFAPPTLASGRWISIDIPFSSMTGLTRRANLAQIILEGGDGGSIYVDNIYFYN
ncbi:MAG TPA: Ig-like domain-containing protein, partial [Saprospiraceae bacterium]|nr:Ig-like domain-containing protein [Saprospiraceae bacterium]